MKTNKNRYFRQISDIKKKNKQTNRWYVLVCLFFFFLDAHLGGNHFGSRRVQQLQLSSDLGEAQLYESSVT